jgi:phospho-N-acetylmuramoyl-pentapeptide-transferase
MTDLVFAAIKVLILTVSVSIIAFALANYLIPVLNRIKFWKKKARQKTIDGQDASVFLSMHSENETTVPRGGGIIIWASILILLLIVLIISVLPIDVWWLKKLNFFSREETWIPLFALFSASLIGLIDDISVVYGKGKYIGGGLSFKARLACVVLIGLIGGAWLYFKLDWHTIYIPLIADFPRGLSLDIGIWYILLFVIVGLASWASGVVDGIDGLAGGVFSSIFAALGFIAFTQGSYDLAVFCMLIFGVLFSFLWFNIPPAKFYMGETGILGLTMTMTAVAFITDSVAVLPIIGGILVIEAGSVILQLLSKKIRKKKIWLSTPIHHHFEATGWKPYQITMRFWFIGVILAMLGVAIKLIG